MSARVVRRALARLTTDGSVLARERSGKTFGVFPDGDRRRRPLARLSEDEVRALEAEGSVAAGEQGFVLSEAGRARVRREQAERGEGYTAQHRAVVDRVVMDGCGEARAVRGHDPNPVLRRLSALRDAHGAPWLSDAELNAAAQVRADWDAGEQGLTRGSDWSAPPNASRRGGANAAEFAVAARCDARRRLSDALDQLAPPLRRVVEHVCFRELGLELLERSEAWPARSGRIALKLALSQLAAGRR